MSKPQTTEDIKTYYLNLLLPCLKELEMGKDLEAEVFINSLIRSVRKQVCDEIEFQIDELPISVVTEDISMEQVKQVIRTVRIER